MQWRLQPLDAALHGSHGPKRKMASVWLSAVVFFCVMGTSASACLKCEVCGSCLVLASTKSAQAPPVRFWHHLATSAPCWSCPTGLAAWACSLCLQIPAPKHVKDLSDDQLHSLGIFKTSEPQLWQLQRRRCEFTKSSGNCHKFTAGPYHDDSRPQSR